MLFTASKDEWNTKEDVDKSLKDALHILRYAKSTSRAEAMSNSEKFKPSYAGLKALVSVSS